MKVKISIFFLILSCLLGHAAEWPWSHGDLRVSDNGLYLQHEDGTPFFWLGDTGWLLPQRLDRDEAQHYLEQTASEGYYIGMVCIWGGLVKGGLLTEEQAETYGMFLADRYKDRPNIIWIIDGDIQGDVKTSVWDALALSIKAGDPNHLMTFHPRGRTTS